MENIREETKRQTLFKNKIIRGYAMGKSKTVRQHRPKSAHMLLEIQVDVFTGQTRGLIEYSFVSS
jgi:hypothetical protein